MTTRTKPRITRQAIPEKIKLLYLDREGCCFDREPSERGSKQLTIGDLLAWQEQGYKIILMQAER